MSWSWISLVSLEASLLVVDGVPTIFLCFPFFHLLCLHEAMRHEQ